MLTALLFLLAAETSTGAAEAAVEPNPKAMSRTEIRAHNATLDKDHPYYIRCVKAADTGSLIARSLSCRTNEQWTAADRTGNQNARDTVEAMQSKATNSN